MLAFTGATENLATACDIYDAVRHMVVMSM